MYPEVPRLWQPAETCPDCAYPNDQGFRFCQRCGFHKDVRTTSLLPKLPLDLSAINTRLVSLQTARDKKPYEKQTSHLQRELESFLASLPSPKSLLSATPGDVVRFLIWRDRFGKTTIHVDHCPHFGSGLRRTTCNCPTRLAAATVDNNIAKLRTIFLSANRSDAITSGLASSNPAAHPMVKRYLTSMREEQAQARVTPRQALPFFFDKFQSLCRYLRQQASTRDLPPTSRYLFARDLAFFCLDFYSGDRASDLGRIKTKDILLLPDNEGLLFRHTFGKTLRGNGVHSFAVRECANPTVCPVKNLFLYVLLAETMCVTLRDGYLFRTSDSKGRITHDAFQGSAVGNRLRRHLNTLKLFEGETMHSFRSGCSITLSLLGASDIEVAQHVGWKSLSTAQYYTKTRQVVHTTKTATLLSQAASSSYSPPPASRLGSQYRNRNHLEQFSLAFP